MKKTIPVFALSLLVASTISTTSYARGNDQNNITADNQRQNAGGRSSQGINDDSDNRRFNTRNNNRSTVGNLTGIWFDSAGRTTTDLRNPQYILRLDSLTSVTLTLTSETVEPQILLIDRNNEVIYEGSNQGKSSDLILTLDAGEYVVVAGTQTENQNGSYQISSNEGDLHGAHVSFVTQSTSGQESAYYQKLDPNNNKNTYAKWLSVNGFAEENQTPNANEVQAIYYNNADLRLGRDMRCIEHEDGRAACTTVNYGSPGNVDQASSSLQSAILHNNPLAAVTMEYDRSNTENPVSFWVYNLQSNEQERIEFLQLDNEHEKSVPGVCLNCHAGSFDSATSSVTGASFLPFDLETFKFEEKGQFSEAALSEPLRKMNAIVKRVSEGVENAAIPMLIDGWYGSPDVVDAVFDKTFVPPTFSANRNDKIMYKEVYQKFCVSCHAAVHTRAFNLVEAHPALIKAFVQPFLCQTQEGLPIMPHAEASDIQFWENPLAQKLLIDDVDACRQTRFGEGLDVLAQ